jgi:HAD superfamily hydrolase (TIGR01484 family)
LGLYRLITLDMDGTLLNEDKEISAENKFWIREATDAGIVVSMATGRGRPHIIPFMEQLDLETPFVAVNGSEVWKNPKDLHRRILMETETLQKLHQLATHFDTWFWAYSVNQVYNKQVWTKDVEGESWLKFGYYTENARILEEITKEISSWGNLELTNSDPNNIECNPLGIHKGDGIKEICSMIGCTMSEVVAMGDSMNDMAMIQEAGLGVAMGNAQEAIKAVADVVTLSNQENGVAEIIRNYVLK